MNSEAVEDNKKAEEKKPERSGARNLALLAVLSTVIAVATTGIGLHMYVSSGDIYLDRSLPGLLPETSEREENSGDEQYTFSDSGAVDKGVIDDFLKHFDETDGEIKEFSDPFSDKPLTDSTLLSIPEGQE